MDDDSLRQKIGAALQQVERLRGETLRAEFGAETAREAVEALTAAVADLRLAGEELRQQTEYLASARAVLEADLQRYQALYSQASDGSLAAGGPTGLGPQLPRPSDDLENRIADRTQELQARVEQVDSRNRVMTDLLGELQAANRLQGQANREQAQVHALLLEQRVSEQAALLTLAQALLGENDVQAIMDAAAREAAGSLRTDFSLISLLDDDGRASSVRATSAWPAQFLQQYRDNPSDDAAGLGRVMRTGESVAIADYEQAAYFAAPAYIRAAGIRAALIVPLLSRETVRGALAVDSRTPREWHADDVRLLSLIASTTFQALERAWLFEQVRDGREQLHALSLRLVSAQETERRDLARELHDELGQVLTGLKLTLDMSVPLADGVLRSNLEEAGLLASDLMTQLRALSLRLRPAVLDDLGLLPALQTLFDRYMAQTGVKVIFEEVGLAERRFQPQVETAAYRIVQESLTNVARYAHVTEAWVRVRASAEAIWVQVENKGLGFEVATGLAAYASSGLVGMRERATLLGGTLSIESDPGGGTRVTADLPLGGEAGLREYKKGNDG